jgi:hypothetical protein
MSRRRRRSSRPQTEVQIEWFKNRTGYPSPGEREEIIRVRKSISAELILHKLGKASPDDHRYSEFIDKYGKEEVQRAEKKFREGMDMSSRVADDARSYRDYRLRYSHFGAGLMFYSAKEIDDLYDSYFAQLKNALESESAEISDTENEFEKLLLIGWRDWEDITAPAIPPRPATYNAPQPASYPAPINELLEWGDDLHRSHQFADEVEYLQWKKFIPALTRMALDPGLLNGWPSEKASWAAWHAVHALGNLQAWESAPALAELADIGNDWLSDHLPHIWVDIGREVEPSLWMILETHSSSAKQRGLAAEGLFMMTEENEVISDRVTRGFEKILQNKNKFDSTLNGYLVMFLKDMEIPDKALDTIHEAFEEDRIDSGIITPEDLEDDD